MYQPKTGDRCTCKRGIARDNCPHCEGTGWRIDFAAILRTPGWDDETGTQLTPYEMKQARGPGSYSFPAYDPFKRGTK